MNNRLIIEPQKRIFDEKYSIYQTNSKFKRLFGLFFILFLFGIFIVFLQNNSLQLQGTQSSEKLEHLIQKITNDEVLTEKEWSELCQLLETEKSIFVTDCEACRDYIRALLGGKHDVFFEQYSLKTDKELQKGIRSFQKQIDEHYDKIANPEKHLSNWKELDYRQQKHLKETKWFDDIKRQKEQQQILECILKNR